MCHLVGSATWGVSTTAAWPPPEGTWSLQEQVARFKELMCVFKGENWASWGSMLEAALQTAAVISSMFTASSTTHLNQSF